MLVLSLVLVLIVCCRVGDDAVDCVDDVCFVHGVVVVFGRADIGGVGSDMDDVVVVVGYVCCVVCGDVDIVVEVVGVGGVVVAAVVDGV